MNTEIRFAPKQQRFAEAVFSGLYNYLLYGGAIRSGKTVVALSIVFIFCRIYPMSRWAIVRKDLPTLRRNTIPSFERIRPVNFIEEPNKTIWISRCRNGSEILFFPESLKDDPDLDRWKGLEVNGFVLEEMNELSEKTFSKAIERAGTWRCPGEQPRPLVLGTCNPTRNWVKRIFYDKWDTGVLKPPYYFLPAKPGDNPHNTKEYLESLERLKEIDPAAYARYVEGDWERADDPRQLIKYEWVIAARNIDRVYGKKRLGGDIGHSGPDDTTIAHLEGNALVKLEYFKNLKIPQSAEKIRHRIEDGPVDAPNVKIDVVGIGAGVGDILTDDGYDITPIISGSSPIKREGSYYRYNNLRSQMWWEFREKLRLGRICIEIDDPRLVEDLTAVRYVEDDKVVKVESKKDIKKRIGRSTDAGDAVVQAYFDTRKEECVGTFELPGSHQEKTWMM